MPDGHLRVLDVVPRDDGRFYVPVACDAPGEGESAIVFRVSSDAFDGDRDRAVDYTANLVDILNAYGPVKG